MELNLKTRAKLSSRNLRHVNLKGHQAKPNLRRMTKKTLRAKSKSRLMLLQIQTVRLKPPPNPKRQLPPPAKILNLRKLPQLLDLRNEKYQR